MVAMNDSGARESYETGAIREPSKGKGAFELITPFAEDRLALWYEAGAEKYELRNWEKGIKFSRLMQSTMRHINKWRKGMRDEDHLAAAAWNLFGMIHFEGTGQDKDLNDMPNYVQQYALKDLMSEKELSERTTECTDDMPICHVEQCYDLGDGAKYSQDPYNEDMFYVDVYEDGYRQMLYVSRETIELLDKIKPNRNHGWRKYDIYAVDFDGCLCENKWPEIGDMNEALFGFIAVRKAQGDKFILWTCREGDLLRTALEWCADKGIVFNAANQNIPEMNEFYGNDSRKIGFDFVLDDKAIGIIAGGSC